MGSVRSNAKLSATETSVTGPLPTHVSIYWYQYQNVFLAVHAKGGALIRGIFDYFEFLAVSHPAIALCKTSSTNNNIDICLYFSLSAFSCCIFTVDMYRGTYQYCISKHSQMSKSIGHKNIKIRWPMGNLKNRYLCTQNTDLEQEVVFDALQMLWDRTLLFSGFIRRNVF